MDATPVTADYSQAVAGSELMTSAHRLLYLRIGDARALAPARPLAAEEVADLRWVLGRMLLIDRATRRRHVHIEGLHAWQEQIEAAPWWPGVYLLWHAGGFRGDVTIYQLDDGRFLSLAPDWSGWLACPSYSCVVRAAVIPPPRPARSRKQWTM